MDVMNMIIGGLFMLFSLYLLWLFVFVFKFNFIEFLSWKQKMVPVETEKREKAEVSEEATIVGKTQARFIEKMPVLEEIKPCLEEPLPLKEKETKEEEVMPEEEIEENDLTDEEKEEIQKEVNKDIWEDDFYEDEFRQRGSYRDLLHTSQVITGQKTSERDLEIAKETLQNTSEEIVELFALHAVNEKKIQDMLAERLDEIHSRKQEDSKSFRQAVKEFVVEDYIS